MKVRDLGISDSINLKGSKEFNHLRITDLEDFLKRYGNNLDYYKAPFQILAELEAEIKFKNKPEKTILISYKPGGDCIFDLREIRLENNLRVVEYSYSTTVS